MLTALLWVWCAASAAVNSASPASLTPAQQKIAAAQRIIDAGKPAASTYNQLAMALAQRARETADPSFYEKAEQALGESFRLTPNNFEGEKVRVWLLLGQHQFAPALTQAKLLNQRMPDDIMIYGMLVDAHVELGNYRQAEAAAQWMLDLRPGHVAGLTRAAYLRELFGDLEGAAELMVQAYQRTPPLESEERAWILTHLAHLYRLSGRLSHADGVLNEALRLVPEYHYALAELAKVRLDEKKFEAAVTLLRRYYQIAPHPENLFALGEALLKAGHAAEAQNAFDTFEREALAESSGPDNANRELIACYVHHIKRPAEALRLAELELTRRGDIQTRAVYALALLANNRTEEARRQLEKVLAVGTRDPTVLEYARRAGVRDTVAAVP